MRRTHMSVWLFLLPMALLGLLSPGRVAAQAPTGVVNVRDYGAKGDGVADDTTAFQAALQAVGTQLMWGQFPGHGLHWGSEPVLLVPPGHYILSETLDLPDVMRGEGYPLLEMTDPTKDLFHTDYCWRNTVQGLAFVGGKTQVFMTNPNLDTGYIQIRDCRFHYSTGPALVMTLSSAHCVVEDCMFIGCRQAMFVQNDQVTMDRLWISSDPEMSDQAVLKLRCGIATIDNV